MIISQGYDRNREQVPTSAPGQLEVLTLMK
jgi:hypothetical protein